MTGLTAVKACEVCVKVRFMKACVINVTGDSDGFSQAWADAFMVWVTKHTSSMCCDTYCTSAADTITTCFTFLWLKKII